jgi:bifunctional DNA-binding transcriptional regulator/antitoxin component of YhaV-PrlF toxin-antitoxin module
MRKRMTITIKSKSNLVVPESIRRAAGFKNGDQLEFKVSKRMVTIFPKPKKLKDDDTVLTPAEAKKVRLGMKQIKEGKFKLWSDVKHGLGH